MRLKRLIGLVLLLAVGRAVLQDVPPTPEFIAEAETIDRINTAGWSDSPFMTLDGQQLYFMYTPYNFYPWLMSGAAPVRLGPQRPGHHDDPHGNPWGDSDIYVSQRQPDGSWTAPINLSLNDENADACGMLLADGSAFYWQKGTLSADLYVSQRQPDGTWGPAQALPAPINLDESHEVNPHISADDQTLWFSSDRARGYGGMDLYVATRDASGAWSSPVNLGSAINSAEDEDQIWVSEEGQQAYFNRGLIIYQMQRSGAGWTDPQQVEFEGGPLRAAEVSLTRDGQIMMLAVPDIPAQRLLIAESRRLPDGRWSRPKPID